MCIYSHKVRYFVESIAISIIDWWFSIFYDIHSLPFAKDETNLRFVRVIVYIYIFFYSIMHKFSFYLLLFFPWIFIPCFNQFAKHYVCVRFKSILILHHFFPTKRKKSRSCILWYCVWAPFEARIKYDEHIENKGNALTKRLSNANTQCTIICYTSTLRFAPVHNAIFCAIFTWHSHTCIIIRISDRVDLHTTLYCHMHFHLFKRQTMCVVISIYSKHELT